MKVNFGNFRTSACFLTVGENIYQYVVLYKWAISAGLYLYKYRDSAYEILLSAS